MHKEETPSLMFDERGRWYCFGCKAFGDAADLYAGIYGVTLGEALRVVRGAQWRPELRKSNGYELKRAVEKWKEERCHEYNERKLTARAIIKELESTAPESDQFWQAVADEASIKDTLNMLGVAKPMQLVKWAGGTIE